MLIDGRSLETGTTLESDVCIVGAGAAGLATALDLIETPKSVVLIESGTLPNTAGRKENRARRRLTEGTARGRLLNERNRYLRRTRTRAFGGLGEEWRGSCRPFDPEDFAARDWVAGSGWPFGPAELEPWLERAAGLLDVKVDDSRRDGLPPLLGDGFERSWLPYARSPSIAGMFRPAFESASNTRVLLRANATALELDGSSGRIAAVAARCLGGPRFTVRARVFVLAAGTIENARLLLASNAQRPRGIGNENDLVGRFFTEQVVLTAGYAASAGRPGALAPYLEAGPHDGGSRPVRGIFRPPGALQERHELLNSLVTLEPPDATDAAELVQEVGHLTADARDLETGDGPDGPVELAAVKVRGEQSPNAASCVVLGEDRDALGLPTTDLTWQISEHDSWSLRTTARLFGESLGRAHHGRVQLRFGQLVNRRHYRPAGHQSGTTRMSARPARGVVDPDCRIHDVENLFVAGSSVFPTGGCSGPMLTVIALALRLGAHLRALENR